MTLETRLYSLREGVETLLAIGRMEVIPGNGGSWTIVMNPVNASPAFMHYRVDIDSLDTITDGWVAARIRLVVNADYYLQCPVTWWAHPSDAPSGIVRWFPYGDEGTHLLTIRVDR